MAIMWSASVPAAARQDASAADIAWRLRFARVLVASGFEAAIVREALVPNEVTMPECASPGEASAAEP